MLGWPGVARRRLTCLLLRQKKVSKEKATLLSATLRCATGTLRCSLQAGSAQTRFAQTARGPDPPEAALLGAARRGGEKNSNSDSETREERLPLFLLFAFLPSFPTRSGWACAGRRKRDQGRALFEPKASLRGPPLSSISAGCPKRSAGTQTAGSPFFCLLFFGEAKKSESPPGDPRPAKPKKASPATKQGMTSANWQTAILQPK